jgi:hypothetical protein
MPVGPGGDAEREASELGFDAVTGARVVVLTGVLVAALVAPLLVCDGVEAWVTAGAGAAAEWGVVDTRWWGLAGGAPVVLARGRARERGVARRGWW